MLGVGYEHALARGYERQFLLKSGETLHRVHSVGTPGTAQLQAKRANLCEQPPLYCNTCCPPDWTPFCQRLPGARVRGRRRPLPIGGVFVRGRSRRSAVSPLPGERAPACARLLGHSQGNTKLPICPEKLPICPEQSQSGLGCRQVNARPVRASPRETPCPYAHTHTYIYIYIEISRYTQISIHLYIHTSICLYMAM